MRGTNAGDAAVTDTPLTARQQVLAAVAIGTLALAGSIGAMRAGRGECALVEGAFGARAGFVPLPEPGRGGGPSPEKVGLEAR